ncbi:MAG: hypothetical protein ACK4RK_16275 [Gemmataceae bacterium]
MDILRQQDLTDLLKPTNEPCLSVLMPTHRRANEEDPIRFKNLLKDAEQSLRDAGWRGPEAKDFLAPARQRLDDPLFWQQQSDGLAYFLAPGFERCYHLPLQLPELMLVGKRFQVKPLLPLLTDNGRFFVLAISQKQVRLLEGTAHQTREIDLKNIPHSLAEALRFDDKEEPLLFRSLPSRAGAWGAIFHGQGVGIDDHKDDLLRYFQAIDRGLHEYLRGQHAPLLLASVEYLWPIYRQANKYPHLLDKGISGNPDRLSNQELHAQAWPLVEPHFLNSRRKAADLYRQLAGTGRTTDQLAEVAQAAHQGQLEMLFVPCDRQVWGTVADEDAKITIHAQREVGDEDLLNFVTTQTLRHGGTVFAVGSELMPNHGTIAAIYRLPFAKRGK